MEIWRIHWLEAGGSLQTWREPISAAIDTTRIAISNVRQLAPFDILVQSRPGQVIPEIGMVGAAHHKFLFSLTIDPDNRNFSRCFADSTFARQVAHEAHHCFRMAGPGYGRTLREALVSEGLAGQFVKFLFGNAPEPWECAVDNRTLRDFLPTDAELAASDYHHASWFFGADGKRPRWLGYTLGYQLAGLWRAEQPPLDSSSWFDIPAETVLASGLRALRSAHQS